MIKYRKGVRDYFGAKRLNISNLPHIRSDLAGSRLASALRDEIRMPVPTRRESIRIQPLRVAPILD